MNIEGTKNIRSTSVEPANKLSGDNAEQVNNITPKASAEPNTEASIAFDKITGLLQSVVTDKLSQDVIRKMPPDEYLKLLSLLDEMISGTIDNRV
ncbi:flagellar protein FlaG [Legionella spiritensis]|uniref:FlaG protein n=1 Tax=Legionella spiritensis TaxID=452 RepID=A0A0W0Z4U4_LEGSP|nr:flagellar protein FlaG [Legionella spiritensis]KTD64129.1 FlaG protein [Legionella spiritensis]SNV37983.1 FlaG protein [Legionella spiritensis]